MIRRKATLVVAALALGTAMGVTANEPWFGKLRIEQETVRFGDLDMKTPAGVATLHLRLREAASNVCSLDGLTAGGGPTRTRCRTQSIERTVATAPAELQAYHAEWKADGANWSTKPSSPAHARRVAHSR